jgi:hypothetical protein
MTCIGLLEDFTKDFGNKKFRIIARRKTEGDYYNGLREFLLRYYTAERADNELKKVLNNNDIDQDQPALIQEIYRCLAYLTEFVYDKISEKRKRAIDDMRNVCIDGLSENESWLHLNEKLKDFIFYYFNSKYAKTDYATDFGEPYSLVIDTDEGKFSNAWIVEKYLKVASDENVIGISTPLDNIKHLFGAIRLISRSLTDRNPSLEILEAFCLVYLGFKKNDNLRNQFYMRLTDGMTEMHQRFDSKADFKIHGRGGTSFEPVTDYYDQNFRKFNCLIYFTDGEAPAPEKCRGPVLWVISSQSQGLNEDLKGLQIQLPKDYGNSK